MNIDALQQMRESYQKALGLHATKALLELINADFPWVDLRKECAEKGIEVGCYWTQHTPHFNDGDPCEFGYHIESDYLLWFKKDGERYSGWTLEEEIEEIDSDGFLTSIRAKYESDCNKLAEKLNCISSDIFQALGEGDVFVGLDSIEVEETDHD